MREIRVKKVIRFFSSNFQAKLWQSAAKFEKGVGTSTNSKTFRD
jgi:hypothetical protein